VSAVEVGRWLLVFGLGFCYLNSALRYLSRDLLHYWKGFQATRLNPRSLQMAIAGALGLAIVPPLILFGADRFPVASAVWILGILIVIRRLEIAQWPDNIVVDLGRYVPAAACLSAWLVVQLLLWGEDVAVRERIGWNAAVGVMGAAYTMAGVTKVREAGFRWARPSNIALLLFERSYSGPRWQRALRRFLAARPLLCGAGATVALWIELLAWGIVVPELRAPVVVAATGLQASITLTLGYFEPEWIAALIAVVLLAA